MAQAYPMLTEGLDGAACRRCGGKMRLFGIEAHSTLDDTDLRTFVCAQCDAVQVEITPVQT